MGSVSPRALDVYAERKGVNPRAVRTRVRLTLAPESAKWQENNIRRGRRQCLGWSGGLQPWVERSTGTGTGNLLPAAAARQRRSHCQRRRHRSHRRPRQ